MTVRAPRVALAEVTVDNLQAVLALQVAESQRGFVASNAKSIAEAHFHEEAWFRAVVADGEPVGFLMLHDENLRREPREADYYFLWRLMIDERFQGRGFGVQAVELLLRHVATRPNARVLRTSCHTGEGSPEAFYRGLGFEPTGERLGEEIELARPMLD